MKILAVALVALAFPTAALAAERPVVQPGQSWDAACEAAAPGDVIPLAAGNHPPQSVSCRKAAPGVVLRPVAGADVLVGAAGRDDNCVNLRGSSYVEVAGVRTTTYTLGGKPGQCGVSVGRGSSHVTLRNVDAGHIFVAADDVKILGGDFGPTADRDGRISDRTCDATNGSCPVRNLLIDGAYFHDHRRVSDHMQCISYDSGVNSTIRNSRFSNCAVFSIFVSGGTNEQFSGLTFENNVYERGPESMSAHVKFSNHGARFKNVVMRNERFIGDGLLIASVSSSDFRLESIAGQISTVGACSRCGTGTHRSGSTVVAIGSVSRGPLATAPPKSTQRRNAAPVACFTRTPNPGAAGQVVTFRASCSKDPTRDKLTFAWDISPGGDGIFERSGATVRYAYDSPGMKTARLRVSDGHGNVVTRAQKFTVGPRRSGR